MERERKGKRERRQGESRGVGMPHKVGTVELEIKIIKLRQTVNELLRSCFSVMKLMNALYNARKLSFFVYSKGNGSRALINNRKEVR